MRGVEQAEPSAGERDDDDREYTPGTAASGDVDVEDEHADDEANADTMEPLTTDGKRAADEERDPARGRDEERRSVCVYRSSAMVCAIANSTAARRDWSALPTTKNVSSSTSASRPRYAKKSSWKSGRDEQTRDADPRVEPAEEGAIARDAADEEDAQRAVMSARASPARARAVETVEAEARGARRRATSTRHIAMSGHGSPPTADSRIARIPQVGASTHEIGSTQPGSSEIGTRSPRSSQTGYSSRFSEAPGRAVVHESRRRRGSRASRSRSTAAGRRSRTASGCSSETGSRTGAVPTRASRERVDARSPRSRW